MNKIEKMNKKPKLSYSEYQDRYGNKGKHNKQRRGKQRFIEE